MALEWTQSLTETSTRNLAGGKGRPARKADNLAEICEPIVYKMWEPRRLTTLRISTACYRDTLSHNVQPKNYFILKKHLNMTVNSK
jgi:hypothetical protein